MARTARTRDGDARRKITHDQILEAAARQVNRRGVAATILKDVAAELGVTRMALYRYVEDREDLVAQCYLRTCAELEARLDSAEGADDAGDVVSRFIDLTLEAGRPELCAVLELGLLPSGKRDLVGSRFDALIARIARALETGAERGQVRICDYEVAARAIVNTVFWIPVADFWNTIKLDRERQMMLDLTKDFIFYGWAADRSRIPAYAPMDISQLAPPTVEAFDREALAEAKRDKILSVASRLFNQKGIDSTTLDDVARELNATSGAISHHVGDKPTLVAACYVRTLKMGIALQTQANAAPGPSVASHTAFQHAWSLAQMRLWPLVPLTGFEALPLSGQQAFHDLVQPLGELAVRHARSGVADGSMRRLHSYATRLQSGPLGWLARAGIRDAVRQEEVAREIAAMIAVGIRPLA